MSPSHHNLLGVWTFTAMPDESRLDVFKLRDANLHLNALRFLEPPVNLHLTVENVQFSGSTVECDVGLRHPFLGQVQHTGFDVCGIVITSGSSNGFSDTGIVMPSEGDTRLLNPDGYTRWWNPVEFPHTDTIFGYKDGLLGTPDGIAHFTSTINGYKYFCDDLDDPDDPLTDVTLDNRGMFTAGQMNYRHYHLDLSGGLVFNYAVDACWKKPAGDSPWTAPDDFPPGANRPEAWRVSVTEIGNNLWNDGDASGGSMNLSIDVYDWYGVGENMVRVESPGNFAMVEASVPIGGGPGFSTYEIDIPSAHPAVGSIDLLITIQSSTIGYGGLLPGKPVCAYFTHTSEVANESPAGPCIDCPWPMYHHDVKHTGHSGLVGPQTNNVAWKFGVGDAIDSSPSIGEDGTIYFGTHNDVFHAVKPDGTLDWSFPIPGAVSIFSSPAIAENGAIYFGGSQMNNVYALNLDGSFKWVYPTGSNIDSSPVIGMDGTIYIHSDDKHLHAINPDGSPQWQYFTGYWEHSSPALGEDGTIYVCNNKRLWAFNPGGTLKWDYGLPHWVNSSCTVAEDGTIYFGCYDYNLYAVTDSGSSAEVKWTYPTGYTIANSTPAIAEDGTVYIGSEDHFLYAISPDGILEWKFETGDCIYSSPAVDVDGLIYFGSRDGHVYCLNPDGSLKWKYLTGGYVNSSPAIGYDGMLFVGSDDGYLYAFQDSALMQFAYSSDKGGDFDIYLTDTDGTFETNLTNHPAVDYMTDFSPDGSILYFNSDRDGDFDVYALDMDTMEITNITHNTETQYGCAASPDGEWIVTIQSWSVIDKDIFRLKADGSMDKSEWINLTNTPGKYDHEPDWSPDGEKIVYYRINDPTGGNDIWTMDSSDGGNKEEIINGPGDEHHPQFSPDGDKVLYYTNKFGSLGIFYYSFADDQNYIYIDESGVDELCGSFSPEGEYVIFTIGEPGDIYYAPFPEAGVPIPLVTGPGHDSWPVWRPM